MVTSLLSRMSSEELPTMILNVPGSTVHFKPIFWKTGLIRF